MTTIAEIVAKLALDATQFTAGVQQSTAAINSLETELNTLTGSVNTLNGILSTLDASVYSNTASLSANTLAVADNSASVNSLVAVDAALALSVDGLRSSMIANTVEMYANTSAIIDNTMALGVMSVEVGRLSGSIVALGTDIRNSSTSNIANTDATNFNTTAINTQTLAIDRLTLAIDANTLARNTGTTAATSHGSALSGVSGNVNQNADAHLRLTGVLGLAAAAIVIVGAAALKEASDLQTAEVTITNATGQLVSSLSDLDHDFGTGTNSAVQLTQAYAGVAGELKTLNDGMVLTRGQTDAFMQTAQQLATATGEPLKESTKSLADMVRDFGDGLTSATQVANGLLGSEQLLGETSSQVAQQFGQVHQILGILNPNFDDTKKLVDWMGQNGPIATRALNQIGAGFDSMLSGTTSEYNALKQYGIYITDAQGNTLPFNTIQGELATNIGSMSEAAGVAALKVLGFGNQSSDAYKYFHDLDQAIKDGTPTMQHYGDAAYDATTKTDTLAGRVDHLKSAMGDFFKDLGTLVASKGLDFLDWLGKLDVNIGNLLIGLGKLESLQGPSYGVAATAIGESILGAHNALYGNSTFNSQGGAGSTNSLAAGYSSVSGPAAGTPLVQGGLAPTDIFNGLVGAGLDPAVATTLTAIALRESSGSPTASNPSGAGGLFQFIPSTWASVGGVGRPQDAPIQTQFRMAANAYASSGFSPWGGYTESDSGIDLPLPVAGHPESVLAATGTRGVGKPVPDAFPNIFSSYAGIPGLQGGAPLIGGQLPDTPGVSRTGPPATAPTVPSDAGFGANGDPAKQEALDRHELNTATNDLLKAQQEYNDLESKNQGLVDGTFVITHEASQHAIDDENAKGDAAKKNAEIFLNTYETAYHASMADLSDMQTAADANDTAGYKAAAGKYSTHKQNASDAKDSYNQQYQAAHEYYTTAQTDAHELATAEKAEAKAESDAVLKSADDQRAARNQLHTETLAIDAATGDGWKNLLSNQKDQVSAYDSQVADLDQQLQGNLTASDRTTLEEKKNNLEALKTQSINTFNDINDAAKEAAAEQKAESAAVLAFGRDESAQSKAYTSELIAENENIAPMWKSNLELVGHATQDTYGQILGIDQQLQGNLTAGDRATLEERKQNLQAYLDATNTTFSAVDDAAKAEAKVQKDILDINTKQQDFQIAQSKTLQDENLTIAKDRQDLEKTLASQQDSDAKTQLADNKSLLDDDNKLYEAQSKLASLTRNNSLITASGSGESQAELSLLAYDRQTQAIKDQQTALTDQSRTLKDQLDTIKQQTTAFQDQLSIITDQKNVFSDIMNINKDTLTASPQAQAIQAQIDQLTLLKDQEAATGYSSSNYDTQISKLQDQLKIMGDQVTIQNEGSQAQTNQLSLQEQLVKLQQDQNTLSNQPQVNQLNQQQAGIAIQQEQLTLQQAQISQLSAVASAQQAVDQAVIKLGQDQQKQQTDYITAQQKTLAAVQAEATSEQDTRTKATTSMSDAETKFNAQRATDLTNLQTDTQTATALSQNAFVNLAITATNSFDSIKTSGTDAANAIIASFQSMAANLQTTMQMVNKTGPYAPIDWNTGLTPGAPTLLQQPGYPQLIGNPANPGAPTLLNQPYGVPQILNQLSNGQQPVQGVGWQQAPPVNNTSEFYFDGSLLASINNTYTYSGQRIRSNIIG